MERDRKSGMLEELSRLGLLLKQDKELPCVVRLVTGAAIRGSWWSHPQAHRIFHELEALAGHPDVLVTKLVAGKDTFVHRRLWPELISIATGGEAWQLQGRSPDAERLFAQVQAEGHVSGAGAAARELRERLLVHAGEVHTAAGRHELRLESWPSWLAKRRFEATRPVAEARLELERVLESLGGKTQGLPWHRFAAAARSGRSQRRKRP
jgi:hypothetical protein